MADVCNQHPKPPGRKARQPIGVAIAKPKPMKPKALLRALYRSASHPVFRGWRKDNSKALNERINYIMGQLAYELVFINAEWAELSKMRAAAKANAKFEAALREKRPIQNPTTSGDQKKEARHG
jgi:hypothetical protein